ncbi:hypothetical protein BJ508DRAFT_312089 [Ascobolus immersus RN42]|uniref:Uncharacterized protein n=1 Tax=Ascobolus immersus RN42 TaxID=1160509 RepID=A0A3N4HU43_ASCIM|nr:hypothetical protein BJ508DRAFT_312089 [Ascobolus immersus RN42]
MSTPPQTHTRRPSLPMIPIPMTSSSLPRGPITPIGYARNQTSSRRSSVSSSLPNSATSQLAFPFRRGSISSISSISTGRNDDEGAIVEDDDYIFNPHTAQKKEEGLTFARRMSFGARAMGGMVKTPMSPVGPTGRGISSRRPSFLQRFSSGLSGYADDSGFFPDSEPRTTGLKDHLDGQRRRGMSVGQAPQGLRVVDAQVQRPLQVKTTALEMRDPFEERIVRGEMYMD